MKHSFSFSLGRILGVAGFFFISSVLFCSEQEKKDNDIPAWERIQLNSKHPLLKIKTNFVRKKVKEGYEKCPPRNRTGISLFERHKNSLKEKQGEVSGSGTPDAFLQKKPSKEQLFLSDYFLKQRKKLDDALSVDSKENVCSFINSWKEV